MRQFLYGHFAGLLLIAAMAIGWSGSHVRGEQAADTTSPETEPGWWQPQPEQTWQIQFSGDIDTGLPVDVYDLDGFDTSAETVSMLHDRGIRVLCYINTGTWEDWRPDADLFPDEVIGNGWDEWEGERFLDIRRLDLLAPILETRFDMCRDKGFDAIEPDNIDTFQNGEDITGFDLTETDQLAFNRWLSDAAHARGLAIGQKNIPELTSELEPVFDFAVTEDCFVDGWCDEMSIYVTHGKPVFAIEYTDTGADLAEICPDAATLGFAVVLKHRELDAFRQDCGNAATPAATPALVVQGATGCDALAGYFGEIGDLVRGNRGLQLIPGSASTIGRLSDADRVVVAADLAMLIDDLARIEPPQPAVAWQAAYVQQLRWYRDLAGATDTAAWQGLINNDRRITREVGMAIFAGQAACGAVWTESFGIAFPS